MGGGADGGSLSPRLGVAVGERRLLSLAETCLRREANCTLIARRARLSSPESLEAFVGGATRSTMPIATSISA